MYYWLPYVLFSVMETLVLGVVGVVVVVVSGCS